MSQTRAEPENLVLPTRTVTADLSKHEQQRIWIATICAAIAFYPVAPFRTGAAELLLGLTALAVRLPTSYLIAAVSFVALASLLPVAIFLLWSRPQFDRPGLPLRSLVLLGLLLILAPIQAVFDPQWLDGEKIDLAVVQRQSAPMVVAIRHLDKGVLPLLLVWACWQRQAMTPLSQLGFHFLLALCLTWALSAPFDFSFGLLLQRL